MSFLSLKPATGLINAHVTAHDANITLKKRSLLYRDKLCIKRFLTSINSHRHFNFQN
jgi:hypothetical protein